MSSCAGSLRPVTAAEPTAACSGTRRWSNAPHREPSSPFGDRLPKWRCWRSEVITLPRWHALDDRPRSGPRQAAALHSSLSFCPTFCGQTTALRHCRLRWGHPSRASTASARACRGRRTPSVHRPPRVRSLHASLPTQDNKTIPNDLRRKQLRRIVCHAAPTSPQVASNGHTRPETAGDSRAGPSDGACIQTNSRCFDTATVARNLPSGAIAILMSSRRRS